MVDYDSSRAVFRLDHCTLHIATRLVVVGIWLRGRWNGRPRNPEGEEVGEWEGGNHFT